MGALHYVPMAGRQSLRSTIAISLLATVAWSVVTVWTDGGTWRDSLFLAPLFFAMIFFTMLATNRLSARLGARLEARQKAKQPQRGPTAVPPTSERSEHNQRRRERLRTDRARADRDRRRH